MGKLSFSSNPNYGFHGSIELNICLAQLFGVPITKINVETFKYQVFIRIYGAIIFLVFSVFYTAFEIYDLIGCWTNLDALTQNACLTLTHIGGLIKFGNILYRATDIREVTVDLKFLTRKYVVSEKQKKTFVRGEFENKIILLVYAAIVGFTGILANIILFYDPHVIAGQLFPYRVKLPKAMPLQMQLAYMSIAVLVIALQIVSIDYLNVTMMNQIRSQLKILNISFNELSIDINCDHPRSKITNSRINSIIEQHNLLLSVRNKVESIFQFPVLVQFFTSLLIFALTGFQATVHTGGSSKAIIIYFYCGCIFFELFIYCWFGNEVFQQSKTLSTNGYNSPWYQCDQRYKKSLLIFLVMSQQPFIFSAGGFLSLSLTTFSGVLSKAYTYIAVLRQLYGGQ